MSKEHLDKTAHAVQQLQNESNHIHQPTVVYNLNAFMEMVEHQIEQFEINYELHLINRPLNQNELRTVIIATHQRYKVLNVSDDDILTKTFAHYGLPK